MTRPWKGCGVKALLQAVGYYVRARQTWELGLRTMKALLVVWDGWSREGKLYSSCSLVEDNMAEVAFIDGLFYRPGMEAD